MTIVEQATILQRSLNDWLKADGGKASIAFDWVELWNVLFKSVNYTRAVICYEGEKLRGDWEIAARLGRVDRNWVVAISRGRGLNPERGDSLLTLKGNSQPFYEVVEQGRDLIRALQGISVEQPVNYMGIEPMQRPDINLDAYLIRFSVAADLPMIVDTTPVVRPRCNWTETIATIVPSITDATPVSFGTHVVGHYRVVYVTGAMSYHSTFGWQINRVADNHQFEIVTPNGETTGPGLSTSYASQALCIAANLANGGQAVEFDHPGGDISMYLHDAPYNDNQPGTPNPTFALQYYSCS